MELRPFRDSGGLLQNVPLPEMVLLRQRFARPRIDDVNVAVINALESADLSARIQPGARIAITVGSRGIADIASVVRSLVARLRQVGAEPFIVPAMGSHGGATPEGQVAVLESLGVVEEYVGAPIVSSLEVDVLGTLPDGIPAYIDRAAHRADGIIVVNRIKPHTDFSAFVESGLAKMIAIGLGKHAGALMVHSWGLEGLTRRLTEIARFVVAHSRILFGLAVVENAYDEVAEIHLVAPEGIGNEPERMLLQRAKAMMPRLPWDTLDVLTVDRLGKNISGAGMDTNITGRMRLGEQKATSTRVTNLTVHDLTEESHGNAIGLGTADFTTIRLLEKTNFQSLYINALTSGVIGMESGKIPLVFATDREAITAAVRTCGRPDSRLVSIARILDTLHLEYILASTTCLEQQMRAGSDVEVLGKPAPFQFEADGSLIPFAAICQAYA
jgi:hypothetical protein